MEPFLIKMKFQKEKKRKRESDLVLYIFKIGKQIHGVGEKKTWKSRRYLFLLTIIGHKQSLYSWTKMQSNNKGGYKLGIKSNAT